MYTPFISESEILETRKKIRKIHNLLIKEKILSEDCKLKFTKEIDSCYYVPKLHKIVINFYQPFTSSKGKTMTEIFIQIYCHEAGHAFHKESFPEQYAELSDFHKMSLMSIYCDYGIELARRFHHTGTHEKIAVELGNIIYKQLQSSEILRD